MTAQLLDRWLWQPGVNRKLQISQCLHHFCDWRKVKSSPEGYFCYVEQKKKNHYRARNWTFDKNSFLVSSESSIWNGSMGENRLKKSRCEVGLKCHQSCFAALAFCTKLYIILAISLCSFLNFLFLRTAEALVLKFGALLLYHFFSNTVLAIFDIFFRSRVIHRFGPKMGQIWHAGVFFNITLF